MQHRRTSLLERLTRAKANFCRPRLAAAAAAAHQGPRPFRTNVSHSHSVQSRLAPSFYSLSLLSLPSLPSLLLLTSIDDHHEPYTEQESDPAVQGDESSSTSSSSSNSGGGGGEAGSSGGGSKGKDGLA